MKNTDIQNIYFRNNGASALYCGSALIWKMEVEEEEPLTTIIRGKFTDDSTSSDWYYSTGDAYWITNKVDISEYVNPQTKEFEYIFPEKPTMLTNLFYTNTKLERIDSIVGIEQVTNCRRMFSECTSLTKVDLSKFKAEQLVNCEEMFYNCNKLQTLDLSKFKGEKVTDCSDMFNNCVSLTKVDLSNFKTEQLTDCSYMFTWDSKLESIFINFKIGENTNTTNMFYSLITYFPNFTTIQTTGGLKICNSIDFGYCKSLTNESVMVIINALEDRSEKETKTLTLHNTRYNQLTPEQIAIGTSKNWTISRF